MNNQQASSENDALLNFDEAKSAIEKGFASTIGTLGINSALLEKQLDASRETVRQLTKHEVGLIEHIQDLEADVAQLRQQLSSAALPLSPAAAALAAAGRAAIQDSGDEEKEKAAPVEVA